MINHWLIISSKFVWLLTLYVFSFMNTMASGHMKSLFGTFSLHFKKRFPSRYAHYYSVKSYIDEYTYVSDLTYSDFKYVVFLFLLLDLFAFLLFASERIFNIRSQKIFWDRVENLLIISETKVFGEYSGKVWSKKLGEILSKLNLKFSGPGPISTPRLISSKWFEIMKNEFLCWICLIESYK